MNLFLYFGTKIFGYSAFSIITVVGMIISILLSFSLIKEAKSGLIWGIVKIIILIIFFITEFPANSVLITNMVIGGLGCLLVFADVLGGGINIFSEILNIIGFFLFRAAFL